MCTTIGSKTTIAGSGKGPRGWFPLGQLYVGYDHPVHLTVDHAISLDFVNEEEGPGARVAVELTREAARELTAQLLDALDRADAYEAGPGAADASPSRPRPPGDDSERDGRTPA